jgi:hypothetical protein
LDELTHVDVRGTARAAQVVLDNIRSLTPAERDGAAAALRVLQVTCPYNRASVQLPLALDAVVSQTDPGVLDPLIQKDWAYLRQGLAAHVAVLDALDAHLPLPVEGDYLHGRLYPDAPMTRAQLDEAPDPVGATRPLLASIMFVVDGYDAATQERIDANFAMLDGPTMQQWPLKAQIIGWRTALQRMQPFLTDGARQNRVAEMIAAIDEYVGLYC